MHHMRRRSLRSKPLSHLRALRQDISQIIEELETEPPRDVDVAEAFDGSPSLLAEDIEDRPECASRGTIVCVQTIYCSESHCDRCPHGPFLFEYRLRPDGKRTKVRYLGIPFILKSQIDEMMSRGQAIGLKNSLADLAYREDRGEQT